MAFTVHANSFGCSSHVILVTKNRHVPMISMSARGAEGILSAHTKHSSIEKICRALACNSKMQIECRIPTPTKWEMFTLLGLMAKTHAGNHC